MSILVNKTGRGRSPVLRPAGTAWYGSSQKESCSPSPIKWDYHAQAASREVAAVTTPEPFLGNV